jgi:hypothetical protein
VGRVRRVRRVRVRAPWGEIEIELVGCSVCCCAGLEGCTPGRKVRSTASARSPQPAASSTSRATSTGNRYLPYLPPMHNTTQYPISLARCALAVDSARRRTRVQGAVQVKRQALPLPSPPPCRLQPRQPSGLVRSGQWARCYTLIRRPFHSFLNPSSLFPFPRQLLDPRPAPPPPSASPASHCLSLPFAAA